MIKPDKKNYRKHNDKNKSLIRKSLEECGAGRSILIDNEDEIIAGNGVYEQAKEAGIPVKIIETDGSELIAVKRTDLSTDDKKRKQLAVMDNSTSDTSEFDLELLQDDFDLSSLSDFGIDIPEEKDIDNDTYSYHITYEIAFNSEEEQNQWFEFLKNLKIKYPDLETISERILLVTNKWLEDVN